MDRTEETGEAAAAEADARFDVAIVGAGIAGASLAAELAAHARVVLIEAEAQPGYHATGRSAAFWAESYGGPIVQPLTAASGPWLAAPPAEFGHGGFLRPRGELHIADAGGRAALDDLAADFAHVGIGLRALDRPALEAAIPGLRPGWDHGLLEPGTADIDVAALHAGYLAAARRHGAMVRCGSTLAAAGRAAGGWVLDLGGSSIRAEILVNAAGAWADPVAALAGVRPLGIQPYRRTLAQLRIDPPAGRAMPLLMDARGRFYAKPEAGGRLWLSPHDETASDPCDAAAEEIDVATAIAALAEAVDWRMPRVERAWAGLRSFAPDRLPVYGFDARGAGFFWFAGQGGFGIQTAPAAAKLAAALLLGRPADAMVAGIDPAPYLATRFG